MASASVPTKDDETEKSGVIASENIDATETDYIYTDELYQQYQLQQNQIEREIAEKQPMISEKIPTIALQEEYAIDDQIYRTKVAELIKRYPNMRRTRGDGSCFYRAFAFGYLEYNRTNLDELNRFRQLVCELKERLIQLNYTDYTVEGIQDVLLEVIDLVRQGADEKTLIETFCNQQYSGYIVAYIRLFVSAHLQMNREFFENFIEGHATVRDFCLNEVEPMGRDADNIHIIALANATNVPIRVVYMDHSEKSLLTIHNFPETDGEFRPMITLLYRPGHYDLLYEH